MLDNHIDRLIYALGSALLLINKMENTGYFRNNCGGFYNFERIAWLIFIYEVLKIQFVLLCWSIDILPKREE
jgi:hypothetical protein